MTDTDASFTTAIAGSPLPTLKAHKMIDYLIFSKYCTPKYSGIPRLVM